MFENTNTEYSRSSHFGRFAGMRTIHVYGLVLCLAFSMMNFAYQDAEAQIYNHKAKIFDADGSLLEQHGGVHPDDSLALVALYHATSGDTWRDNSGWLVDPVDFWVGVDQVENVGTVEQPEWRVTRIRMPQRNLSTSAELPVELGNMEYLQRFRWDEDKLSGGLEVFEGLQRLDQIYFRNQIFTGEIPWDIYSELPALSTLHLRNSPQYSNMSYLVGEIPASIGEFPRLTQLYLMANQLSGSIPPEIANVSTLQQLNLTWNNFTGVWPDMGGLTELRDLSLWANPFDPAPIPEWIQNLAPTLTSLRIFDTNRTGVIPAWITDMTELVTFDVGNGVWYGETSDPDLLYREDMIGNPIPNLSVMPNLRQLRLHGHNFTGPIPDWIADIDALDRLYLIDTGFEGPIPGEIFANAQQLQRIYILNNKNLTGGLPPEMQLATNLERIHIADNTSMEIGEFPVWLSNLTATRELNLSGMGITGDIPSELSALTSIQTLKLRDNPGVTGPIPEWVQNQLLLRLNITRTSMDVPEIPSWLASQGSIIRLGLGGLGMTGTIPDWLGDLNELSHLVLDGNELSGEIPASLGNLTLLDSLTLGNNQLSGQIPEAFANVGRISDDVNIIKTLSLSGNPDLTGPIPLSFTQMGYMRYFEYDGTDLCEPSDPSFSNWVEQVIPQNEFLSYPRYAAGVNGTGVICPTTSTYVEQPFIFRLGHNYPNPFNPTTSINYEIPADALVTLSIYNILGQQVATLVNEHKTRGKYEIQFDASNLASGSYIYKLKAGDRVQTKTMMLIK